MSRIDKKTKRYAQLAKPYRKKRAPAVDLHEVDIAIELEEKHGWHARYDFHSGSLCMSHEKIKWLVELPVGLALAIEGYVSARLGEAK